MLRSSGVPLGRETRAFFEPRFRHDFSHVRVHMDAKAVESAQAVNAVAYTVGRNVVMGVDEHLVGTPWGQRLLAHELAHVAQQSGRSDDGWAEPIAMGSANDGAEHEAEELAKASTNGGSPHVPMPTGVALMRLTPAEFRAQLGATPDQKSAINGLFADAQFKSLWDYLVSCAAPPKRDLGPLALKVTPGLKIGSIERFGGYNPLTRTLEINPAKPEHKANPQELIDTVVHELIHAVDDLDEDCVKAGATASPLKGAGTEPSPPALANVKGKPDEDRLLRELGPGASNPCEEFIDINKKAQQIIVTIIQRNIKTTKIGRPTLTFVNDALRNSPAALAEYKKCRDRACANTDAAVRQTEIGRCAEAIVSKYVTPPPAMSSTPAPAPGVFPPSPPPPKMSSKKQKQP